MLGLAAWYSGTKLRECYIDSVWSPPEVPKAVSEKPKLLPTDARAPQKPVSPMTEEEPLPPTSRSQHLPAPRELLVPSLILINSTECPLEALDSLSLFPFVPPFNSEMSFSTVTTFRSYARPVSVACLPGRVTHDLMETRKCGCSRDL